MATARTAVVHDFEADYREITDWYRDLLERTPPPTGLAYQPMYAGPAWQHNGKAWVLPERTLGWRFLAWCGLWLKDKSGQPWQFTPEQARVALWRHALADTGRPLFQTYVLQRLKGWGKDPFLATEAAGACFAPIKFAGWDANGDPLGDMDPAAWVQLIAVSQQQTQNTMKLFPSLFTREALDRYGIQVGRLNVWGLGDTVQIEAITSNYLSVEGGRPTLVGRNETQNWNSSNQGHEMAGAIEGNVAKSERGTARILDVCNAYRPGEDSVGERARDAWVNAQAAGLDIGVCYDSLEAPPDAPLTREAAPAVLDSIKGDSWWLETDVDGPIVKSILNTQNPPSESRRKWYNQITATADAWINPLSLDAQVVEDVVGDGTPVVLFFDGSKSDDSTGIVGVRLSDGFTFQAGCWERLPNVEAWQVDREAVDIRMCDLHDRLDVRGLFADPSDARDDETGERFWEDLLDTWGMRWGSGYDLTAVGTGPSAHPVIWDMRSPAHQTQFVEAAERCMTDILEGKFPWDGSRKLGQHLKNARRRPSKYGVSLGKEHRDSRRKVDLAVCAVGARMMWRTHKATVTTEERSNAAAFFSI